MGCGGGGGGGGGVGGGGGGGGCWGGGFFWLESFLGEKGGNVFAKEKLGMTGRKSFQDKGKIFR